jgi:hypothetical protein
VRLVVFPSGSVKLANMPLEYVKPTTGLGWAPAPSGSGSVIEFSVPSLSRLETRP